MLKDPDEVAQIQDTCNRSFFVFSKLSFLPTPHCIVLCHLHPLISKTLNHCLLPPPHSEATSMTLGAQFLLQVPKPCHVFMQDKVLIPLFGSLVVIRATCPHHEKQPARHVGICVLPCSCAAISPILSCGESWHRNHLSQHTVLYCAQMCTLCTC